MTSSLIRSVLAGAMACVALAACSSPPARFYRLQAADGAGPVSAESAPALLVDVLPVRVPRAVADRRLVVQASAGQVEVLEMDRWASPAADEIRAALLAALAQQTGNMNRHGLEYDGKRPVYRVAVDVQRFDSWRGSHVLIDAVWTIWTADDRQVLTCRSVVRKDVPEGIDGLVQGHRRALKTLGSQIAEALVAYDTTPSPAPRQVSSCVASEASALAN